MAHRVVGACVVLVWSTCFVAIKGTEGVVPPVFYAALRALVAAAVLLVLSAVTGRLRPPAGSWLWLVALGFSSTTLGLAGMFLSVEFAGAALPAVLANSQAVLAAPFAVWLFGERLTMTRFVGLIVGLSGVVLTVAGGASGGGSSRMIGLLLGLLSALGLAGGSLLMKHLAQRVDALVAVTWQYATGGVLLLAWSLALDGPVAVPWDSLRFLAGLAYLGVVASAGASVVWFWLLRTEDLNPLNALTLLSPTLSLALAWWLFSEVVSSWAVVGMAATLVGVAMVSVRLRTPSPGERLD